MSNITERFIELCNNLISSGKVKNHAQIVRDIGITSSAMTEIKKGRAKAEIKIVQGTVSAYPYVNARWLLTGAGDMFETKTSPAPAGDVKIVDGKRDDLTAFSSSLRDLRGEVRTLFGKLEMLGIDVLQIKDQILKTGEAASNVEGKGSKEHEDLDLSHQPQGKRKHDK